MRRAAKPSPDATPPLDGNSSSSCSRSSVLAGMGLRMAGMVLATIGLLPPVGGAVFQEAIDVAVILNALRALGGAEVPTTAGRRTLPGISFNQGSWFRRERCAGPSRMS